MHESVYESDENGSAVVVVVANDLLLMPAMFDGNTNKHVKRK